MPKWEVIEWKDNKAFQSYIEAPTETDANVILKTQGIEGTVTGFIVVDEYDEPESFINKVYNMLEIRN